MQFVTPLFVAFVASSALYGADSTSTVTLDWSALTTGQQACVAPSTGPSMATLTLKNPNVILYTYALNVQSYQIPSNDAGNIPAPAVAAQQKAGVDCDKYVGTLKSLWGTYSLFPPKGRLVTLDETLSVLNNRNAQIDIQYISDSTPNACSIPAELSEAAREIPTALRIYQVQERNPPTEINFSYQIDDKHWQRFALTERNRYDGKDSGLSMTWNCGNDDVLTLSLGVLATTLANRTYASQAVPNSTGTQNVLVVNGNSHWNPAGAALLNYRLVNFDWGPQLGVSASTGPVFKFGSSPEVSAFGWFGGLSLSISRRLFLSAGMQLGQFADFPKGFAEGTAIPSGFGTLNPTTRWTSKFAFGVTFQTKSFAKSDQSTMVKSNAAPAAPAK